MIFPIHAFLSRHSFSVGGSLRRTTDQACGKVGGVKHAVTAQDVRSNEVD